MKHPIHRLLTAGLIVSGLLATSAVGVAYAAAAKKGATCKIAGATEGSFTCTTVGRKKTWQPTPVAPTTPPTVAGAATTPAATPTGLAVVPGFDGKTISVAHLGNVAGGPFAVGGKALTAGFLSYLNDYNAKGGIAGKYQVNDIFAETEYSADVASQKYAALKDKVVMVSQIYGTPLVAALTTKLDQDNLIGSPISLDAQWARDVSYLPIGGAYQYQAINILDWANTLGGAKGKKYCAAAHTGPYGDAGMDGYNFAVKALGLTAGPIARFAGTESNMAAVVSQFKAADCGVVFLAEASAQTTGILVNGQQNGFNPLLVGLAPSFDVKQVTNATEALYTKYFYTAVDGPQWGDTTIPGMAPMIASLKRNAPQYAGDINGAFVWGYVQAKSVVALLEKAVALGDLSRAGMKKALVQVGRVPLDGLYPEYDYVEPGKRTPSPLSNIMKVDVSVPGGLAYQVKGFSSTFNAGYKNAKW